MCWYDAKYTRKYFQRIATKMNENEIQYTHISVKCTHVITDRRLERRKLYPFLYQMNENADKNYCCKKP